MKTANYKEIPGFENYLIFRNGAVINTDTGKKIKPRIRKTGYAEVQLSKKGNVKWFLLHRLVAECFCEKKNGCAEVNHIDGDKSNNTAENLEWVTRAENLKHAFLNGLRDDDVSPKIVIGTNIKTGEQMEFNSIYQAARFLGISQGNICMACQGKRPSASGYIWEYKLGE